MNILARIARIFKRQMSLDEMLDRNLAAGQLRYGWEVVKCSGGSWGGR